MCREGGHSGEGGGRALDKGLVANVPSGSQAQGHGGSQHRATSFLQRPRPCTFCKAEAYFGLEAEDLTLGWGSRAAQTVFGILWGPAWRPVPCADGHFQVHGFAPGLLRVLNVPEGTSTFGESY